MNLFQYCTFLKATSVTAATGISSSLVTLLLSLTNLFLSPLFSSSSVKHVTHFPHQFKFFFTFIIPKHTSNFGVHLHVRGQLRSDQFVVVSVQLHELVVRALLDHVAAVEAHDFVCVSDCGKSVGNNDGRASFACLCHKVQILIIIKRTNLGSNLF
jgi:hypothetical protein